MRTTRRKRKGGDASQVVTHSYEEVPGTTPMKRKTQTLVQQSVQKPIQKTLLDLIQSEEQQPVQPYRIFIKGDQDFEIAIANAPKLSTLRLKLSEYHIDYIKKLIRSFNYDDCHKAYVTEKMEDTCFVYVISQLVSRLENAIKNIHENSESLGYSFSSENAHIVTEELNNYIQYFDRNKTYWGSINIDFINAIFD
jgi:hypothetical protein